MEITPRAELCPCNPRPRRRESSVVAPHSRSDFLVVLFSLARAEVFVSPSGYALVCETAGVSLLCALPASVVVEDRLPSSYG